MSIQSVGSSRSESNAGRVPANVAPLFQEGRIGRMILRNRFVQSPIYTQSASAFGEVTDRLIEFQRARARGGVGLIITENCAVDWEIGRSNGHPIRIDHDRFIGGLHELVKAVHLEGAKLAVQLHHTGRQNTVANTEANEPPLAPTGGITSAFCDEPRTIELHEIPELVDMYVRGAVRAVAAGFDAVELHGAHGYLLQQFLSPKTNKRTDDYGGSLENRARFALEVVSGIREAVGPDFPVMYRVSAEEPYEGGLALSDGLQFCEMIEPYIDALDVTVGNYDTVDSLVPMGPPGSIIKYAKEVKKRVGVPVISVGRMAWMFEEAAQAVENGEIDFITMGRSQLADAEVVRKTRRGEPHRVRRCLAVNECVAKWNFAGESMQCVINPETSEEKRAEEARRRVAVSRNIVVVGGGPSGCEAALLAAQRGHNVRLFERNQRLGGQLLAWSAVTFLGREISQLIAFYENELSLAGVEVLLGTEAFEKDIQDTDTALLATGTDASTVPAGAVDAVKMMLSGTAPEAANVTVFGSGETAMYAALWLTEQAKTVSVHASEDALGADGNDLLAGHLAGLMDERGVQVALGAPEPDDVDGVVWAQPRTGSRTFQELVDDERVIPIGTRALGGRLYEATQSGYWTAAKV